MYSAGYCCQNLMKLEFFRQIFRKILQNKNPLKSVQWEPSYSILTDKRTHRHDESNPIVSFRNFANPPKI